MVDPRGLEPLRLTSCKDIPGAHAQSPLTFRNDVAAKREGESNPITYGIEPRLTFLARHGRHICVWI